MAFRMAGSSRSFAETQCCRRENVRNMPTKAFISVPAGSQHWSGEDAGPHRFDCYFDRGASIHSSGEKRTAQSLLSSTLASVVLPERGSPHTMINLGPMPELSISRLSLDEWSPFAAGPHAGKGERISNGRTTSGSPPCHTQK